MKYFLPVLTLFMAASACAQSDTQWIRRSETERIERFLSSDELRGRRTGSPEIRQAAGFIAAEFSRIGLKPAAGDNDFLQTFAMVRPRYKGVKGEIDDVELDSRNIMVITTKADLKANEKDGYFIHQIAADENLFSRASALAAGKSNNLVFVDTAHTRNFPRLAGLKRQLFTSDFSTIFVLGRYAPKEFTFKAQHEFEKLELENVVGILPGTTRPNEYVIFSAHHDHIGTGRAVDGDSIYNGANDDAAGTTAVIQLANYYKNLGNNERTLIFATFTAEEVGGWGAQYFSRQFEPARVMAMFNIEMIGTESKWGRNSAFITGFEHSNLGTIMQRNLQGSGFTFYPDPYEKEQLFYRSDNATLARLGVPAHTISTAKMESEPHYHKPSDEIGTLDLDNMTAIIRSIAVAARSVVGGQDTPTRVKTETLR